MFTLVPFVGPAKNIQDQHRDGPRQVNDRQAEAIGPGRVRIGAEPVGSELQNKEGLRPKFAIRRPHVRTSAAKVWYGLFR